MSLLRDLLAKAVSLGASDIHLKPGLKPFFRVHGDLSEGDAEVMAVERLGEIVSQILPPHLTESFKAEHEADFSHQEDGVGRFRIDLFLAQGAPCLAIRHVKDRVPSFEELSLPTQFRDFSLIHRGIIVLSGTTGSGKSTTLAAMVQHINATLRSRIVTVEDPIEYLFADDQSIISQREIGIDTLGFHAALKHVIRQDPDVIVIGEMRDPITFRIALSAAETGHVVFTTLHSGTAALAVQRILEFFPAGEREQIRMGLAGNLHAIVCQRLLSCARGGGIPAVEVLINTPTVRKLLEKDKLDVLPAAIEVGVEEGMQTFNQAVYKLIKSGLITEKEGMAYATNPQALRMNLQGVFLDESKRILSA